MLKKLYLVSYPDSQKWAYITVLGLRDFLRPTQTYPLDGHIQTEYDLYPGLYIIQNCEWKLGFDKNGDDPYSMALVKYALWVLPDGTTKRYRQYGQAVLAWLGAELDALTITGIEQTIIKAEDAIAEFFYQLAKKWIYKPDFRQESKRLYDTLFLNQKYEANQLIKLLNDPPRLSKLAVQLDLLEQRLEKRSNSDGPQVSTQR